MKKLLIVLVAVLMAAPSFAQKTTVTRVNREKTYKTSSHDLNVWYQGELNFGYGLASDYNMSRVFLETIHGARITKYAYAGIGVGVQYALDWEEVIIPAFVDLKGYYPVTDDFAPYVAIDLGYGAGTGDIDGGFYGSFGAGVNYKKLNFGLGYQKFGEVGSFFVKVGIKF